MNGTRQRDWSVFPVWIVDRESYAVALHEMGHVATQADDDVLADESAAWRWAAANAKWWTAETRRTRTECINSYYFKHDKNVPLQVGDYLPVPKPV